MTSSETDADDTKTTAKAMPLSNPTRQRVGRPRLHAEPRRELYLRLPTSLLEQIDAACDNRTAWIVEAIRQRLERDSRVGM